MEPGIFGNTISHNARIQPVAMEEVGSILVQTSMTDIYFDGLDDRYDGFYDMQIMFSNSVASQSDIRMYANDDTTDTNYNIQSLSATDTTPGAGRSNFPRLVNALTSGQVSGYARIWRDSLGLFRWWSESIRGTTAAPEIAFTTGAKTAAVFSLTKITLHHQNGAGIGPGSWFKLYRIIEVDPINRPS